MRQEQDIFDDLAKLCSSPGYVHAIAYIILRDNMVIYTEEMTAEDMRHLFSENRLIRTEVSTLIGLLIREQIDYIVPLPEVMQQYVNSTETLLEEIHHSMSASVLNGLDFKKAAEEGFNPFTEGKYLREPIFYGGESAYTFQYRDLAVRKYVKDDEWFEANKGFLIQTARDVVHAVEVVQNQKITDTLNSMRKSHTDEWTFLPALTITVHEIAQSSGIESSQVRSVLTAFALPSGHKNDNFKALNDFNVANASPLIPVGDDEFVLFQTYSLVEALYDGPFYWMGGDKSYVNVAMEHRGSFTEEFSKERLELVFGKDNVYLNVDIYESRSRKIGEIDVLVIFGNRAIVVQAKSKRLTIEARKGNDGWIKDDFKKSVQDSYDQGFSCAQLLEDTKFRFVDGESREISMPPEFEEIYIICLVSDHYPALSFQAQQFLKFVTTTTIQPPFVMDVFTLDAMTEMLESPLRILSYINRRTNYSDRLLASHELTILSYHLKQNLWIDNEFDLMSLHDDISADLDVAMTVRREGVLGKRTPDGILNRFDATSLGRIIVEIEARPEPATINLGLMLLTLNEDTVIEISKGIDKLVSQARKDRMNHDMTVGIGEGNTGLTIHCNYDPTTVAMPILQAHCRGRKYTQKADSWFGVCIHPDDASPRFGISLDFKWEQSAEMDANTVHFTTRD